MKIRNSNIEIRNKFKTLDQNNEIRNGAVLNFTVFGHSDLFRISNFVLRIFSFSTSASFAFFAVNTPTPNVPALKPDQVRQSIHIRNVFKLVHCGYDLFEIRFLQHPRRVGAKLTDPFFARQRIAPVTPWQRL